MKPIESEHQADEVAAQARKTWVKPAFAIAHIGVLTEGNANNTTADSPNYIS